ncbi:MAG TPA: type II secretion system F family protein [Terriglobia bacterium]|nr:type II secretion system F family protein [Terriglobia bacterium]
MPAFVSFVVFASVIFIVMALIHAFSGGSLMITERLGRLWRVPGHEQAGLKESRRKLIDTILSAMAKIFLSASDRISEADPRMVQAGFRRAEAAAVFRAARVVVIVALVGLVYFTGFYKNNPVILLVVAALVGFILPDIWLDWRKRARQQRLRLALPDALDLLVICMEAGLGIDQALLYVSQELKAAHRELCEEFDLVNAEMHVGKARLEALRSLATRTGVDDIQALVATLIQTDRFGTSVARSLRIHSDDLRTKRRQRAEELAAKTTIKMLFPLVFFIFPALFVVILGPAVISIIRMFGQNLR